MIPKALTGNWFTSTLRTTFFSLEMTHGSKLAYLLISFLSWLLSFDLSNLLLPFPKYFCREFVGCVRCIRILSPSEVQQMGEEGMQILNANAMQQAVHVSATDGCH